VNLIRNRNRATLRRAGNPKARAILRHGPAYSRVHSVLYLYPGPAQDGTTFLFYQRKRAGHPEEGLSRTFKPQRQANMPVSKGEEGLGKILKFHRQANMPVSPAHRRLALGWKGEEGKQMARAILRHGPAYSRVHSVLYLYPGPAQDGTTFLFYQRKRAGHPEEGLSRTFKPQRQANMPVSKGEEGLGKILKFHRQANMPVSPAHRRLALGWKGEEGKQMARAILRHGPAYSRVHSVLYLYPGPAQDGTTFLFYQRKRAGHPEEGLSRTFKPQRQANMPVSPAHRRLALGWKGEEGKQMARAILRHGPVYRPCP
jgi:CRISPR/Cas system CSM-associated protein Csm2 small subunit